MKKIVFSLLILFVTNIALAQIDNTEFAVPKKYVISGITVFGAQTTDVQTIKLFAGLKEGDKILIPGDKIAKAIQNLWDQDLFADIKVGVGEVRGESIFLVIDVEERSRLNSVSFKGLTNAESRRVREDVDLSRGKIGNRIVNENFLNTTRLQIRNYFVDKGYLNTKVSIEKQELDSALNRVDLLIKVKKSNRVKIKDINFEGLTAVKPISIKRKMKDTKEKHWYRLFKRSKYKRSDFNTDKKVIVQTLNTKGYRNAKLVTDTVYYVNDNAVSLNIKIKEGSKFYFRDITWLGNTKYQTRRLDARLGIQNGDIYDKSKMSERLFGSPNGNDVSSLYLDNGYLSFNANPVEILVENDSIDIEVRVYEGKQYRVNKITIKGNSRTNEHVIRREIRTRPGDLFSRADIIRTQRELSQLGYFDPASFEINPQQNPTDGTVDIEYVVAEKPSDQIELQGGWGNGRVVGTLALSFNNFSMKNFFKGSAWRPLPQGDGQRLSIRAQSNGVGFQSYSLSFVEPWMGGKKPNSFSVSITHSVLRNGSKFITDVEGNRERNPNDSFMKIYGGSVGLGKRLRWPDDYFQVFGSLNFQTYDLQNYNSAALQNIAFDNGTSNNLSFGLSFFRDSRSGNPIFQTGGTKVGITTQTTFPYSAFDGRDDYSTVSNQEKYRWIEYHKYKFTAEWFNPLTPSGETNDSKFVLYSKVGFGYLGTYDKSLGLSPFERFYMGGAPLTGFQFDGREVISLRGYEDNSISSSNGDAFINKYTMELRYLLSPSPSATIFALGFVEAGNSWQSFKDYDPFSVKRSGGVGVRLFLPMFGLLGLDYGWRFDDVFNQPGMPRGQFHFTIGTNLGEL